MKQLVILFLLTTSLCFSQQEKFKALDSFFKNVSDNNKMMGTLVISKNGQVIYDKHVGYANMVDNKKYPITKESKFRIASITKTYTATMVYQLVDEGKLKLTDRLSNFFPQIPNADNITIANMLNHSSGLFEITKAKDFNTWRIKGTTREEMLERIQKYPGIFKPGEKSAYSNSNFLLLGYIIEEIDKIPYAEALKKRIVNALNLKNTYYGGKKNAENNECASFYYKDGKLIESEETHRSVPGGAGGIVATPYDLVTFYEALFTGKLISKKSLETMLKVKHIPYASGLFNGEDAYGHGGGIDGFISEATYKPEQKITIVILTNALNYSISDIVENAFLASQNQNLLPVKTAVKTIALTAAKIAPYAGVYEGHMGKEKTPYTFNFVAEGKVLKGGPNANMLFPLEAVKNNEFVHNEFGIHLKFDLEKQTLIFTQAGKSHTLTKKH
ncbi:serine hydrolase domain-containing protein [Snuella sedimenti]|uniref:Beta-lactamase family protein n=1 Tax=Snuella sedimenti TaxID=2798802 RepID=A0A8J7LXN2_9FLAO|nr:serine hydrolase domain-containing protein [Snuella sedimenti]MBJ6367031.1 beta-lactamase family protein [Snuella sedimenti]